MDPNPNDEKVNSNLEFQTQDLEFLKDPDRRPAAVDAYLRLHFGAEYVRQQEQLLAIGDDPSRAKERIDALGRYYSAASSLGVVNERIDRLSVDPQMMHYAQDLAKIEKALNHLSINIMSQSKPAIRTHEAMSQTADKLKAHLSK